MLDELSTSPIIKKKYIYIYAKQKERKEILKIKIIQITFHNNYYLSLPSNLQFQTEKR